MIIIIEGEIISKYWKIDTTYILKSRLFENTSYEPAINALVIDFGDQNEMILV